MAYPTTQPEETLEPTWEIAQLFPAQGHWSEEASSVLLKGFKVEVGDVFSKTRR